MDIITKENKEGEGFLRKKTKPFPFEKLGKKEIDDLLRKMRLSMKKANGIGLSANQIGLEWSVFIAQVPDTNGSLKFYSIFNPEIEKFSKETSEAEEGCLSVPKTYGPVARAERITLKGQDKNGKPVKIKAWGLLARVFQHEVDHLSGKLFIDKAGSIYKLIGEENQVRTTNQ